MKENEKIILGCHVNFGPDQILGSTKQAISYGANTFMFYTGAPQNTIRKDLDVEKIEFAHSLMKEHGIDLTNVICHAPYIINLANKGKLENWQFGIDFLKKEIARCEKMGITKIVLHPGSAVGITKEEGLKNIIEALNIVVRKDQKCQILLETMAGKGSECGNTLDELKAILSGLNNLSLFGVCLDTCHLHDAGYDLTHFDKFLKEFDHIIGLEKIQCVHVNDSKNALGAHKDRHENFGFGELGFQTLIAIVYHEKLKKVPKILETPYIANNENETSRDLPPYAFEIQMILKKQFNETLFEDIRKSIKKL